MNKMYKHLWMLPMLVVSFYLPAQIVYFDFKPDTTIVAPDNSWGSISVDLNQDGKKDFILNHHNMIKTWNYQKIEMGNENDYAEVLCDTSVFHYPRALNAGDTISWKKGNWFNPSGWMIILNENGQSGNWIGVKDKYLGLRVKKGLQWCYGWIRLDVPADAGSYTVKDFACRKNAESMILAGDNGLSSHIFQTATNSGFSVYPNPVDMSRGMLYFSKPLENANVTVMDVTGKKLEERMGFSGNGFRLDQASVPRGIILIIRIETRHTVFEFRIITQ